MELEVLWVMLVEDVFDVVLDEDEEVVFFLVAKYLKICMDEFVMLMLVLFVLLVALDTVGLMTSPEKRMIYL